MKKFILTMAMSAAVTLMSGAAYAACTTETAKDDLEDAEVQTLYDCILDKMRSGYGAAGGVASEYTGWQAAATLPAAPGPHGKRFLMTFVNETGFAEYVKYSDERGPMPTGTLIAKESFSVSKKGKVKVGPLFIMEKVAAGNADEFGNWVYSAYQPKGKAMKIKQKFCHGCHGAFEDQDSLGYPDEDYWLSSN